MAIFDEQVLEPFVAKGIGNSGVASRKIQVTNLPDLSAAVRQSQMTQQNLEEQQSSTLKALAIKNMKRPSIAKVVDPNDALKPFVIGRNAAGANGTMGEETIVAIPMGNGNFSIKSIAGYAPNAAGDSGGMASALDAKNKAWFKALGIDPNVKAPSLGVSGAGGTYSKAGLLDLLKNSDGSKANDGTSIQLGDIINKINSFAGGSAPYRAKSSLSDLGKMAGPSISDLEWEAGQQNKKKAQSEFDATLAANRLTSRTNNISSMGGPSMLGSGVANSGYAGSDYTMKRKPAIRKAK